MSSMSRRNALVGLVLTTLIALDVAMFLGTRPASQDKTGDRMDLLQAEPVPVTIWGNADDTIAPGAMVPIDLAFDNQNDFALTIERVTVTVTGVRAPRIDKRHPCTTADFEVRQLARGAALRLGRGHRDKLSDMRLPRDHWPAVGLLDRPVNQDGCKGASLTLTYEAHGTEVQ